ncbi:heparinase II/III family protein [candidate division KSB1 bacterium]
MIQGIFRLSALLVLLSICGIGFGEACPQNLPEWVTDLQPMEGSFQIRPDRPRLYVTSEDLPVIKSRIKGSHREAWDRIAENRGSDNLTNRIVANAFSYLITGDDNQARVAVEAALTLSADTSRGDLPNAYRVWPEAVAYDWCYEHWKPEERVRFLKNVREQLRKGGGRTLERHSIHMGHLVNHLADAHLPAGIAFFEEAPEIYQRALKVARAQIVAKNVFYRFGASSQGNSYGVTHYNSDIRMLMMLQKATGEKLLARYPFYRDVGYYWIYTRRPDGQLLRNGDDYLDSGRSGSYWGPAWLSEALVYAVSAYKDPFILDEYLKIRNLNHPWTAINDILHRHPELEARGPEELPQDRWLGGAVGMLLFRTGWGPDDVLGMFKVGPLYVKNHDHLDRLGFQIYCRGALGIDSGLYEGEDSGYGTPHWTNYFQRTIAHNSLLIRDPDETVPYYGRPVPADGGQRFPGDGGNPASLADLENPIWHVSRVTAHEIDPEDNRYAYVAGDATAAYGPKAEMVRRSFVLLKGFDNDPAAGAPAAAFLLSDRVVSSRPDFEKVWMFHSIEEPTLDGNNFTVGRSGGKYGGILHSRTILPGSPRLEKIGGPGADYLVGDINYATRKGGDAEGGAWRVEVTSDAGSKEVDFLHAFFVYPSDAGSPPEITRISGDRLVGADFLDRTVVFVSQEDAAGRIRYVSNGNGPRHHLVLGLPAGAKALVKIGRRTQKNQKVSAAGVLAFSLDQTGRTAIEINPD